MRAALLVVIAPRYRMAHTDCGPIPPDAPPQTCFWTIVVDREAIVHCWSDVRETLDYRCTGPRIDAWNGADRPFTGQLLPDGRLSWQGNGLEGIYAPY